MHINKKLYSAEELFESLSHYSTIMFGQELREIKESLELVLEELRQDSTEIEDRIVEIIQIETQIKYINKNMNEIEEALKMHKMKIFQKEYYNNRAMIFCLN
jgi:hypothetical protein